MQSSGGAPLWPGSGSACSLLYFPPRRCPQVSEACDTVFVAGTESRGAKGLRVDFWWRRLRASLRLTVWAPLLPLRIELSDATLEQIRGWRVPSPTDR